MSLQLPDPVVDEDIVVMGLFGAPFGIRGWVHVYAQTEHPDSLLDYPVWQIGSPGKWRPVKVLATEMHTKSMVVQLEGCVDRDVAAQLRNQQIGVFRSELPAAEDGEYYWSDLIGLNVVNLQDESLGTVFELLEAGSNDLLVVRDGTTQRLIPFVGAIVLDVDLATSTIRVDWGLDY